MLPNRGPAAIPASGSIPRLEWQRVDRLTLAVLAWSDRRWPRDGYRSGSETRSAIPLLGQRRACYPGALEHTQPVTVRDAPLFTDWLIAFHREAVPHDPVPAAKNSNGLRGEDRFLFWIGHGRRVVLS